MEGGKTACRVNCHAISSHYPHTFISTFRKLKYEIGSCKLFTQVCTHSHCTTSLMVPKTLESFYRFSGDAQTSVKRRKQSLLVLSFGSWNIDLWVSRFPYPLVCWQDTLLWRYNPKIWGCAQQISAQVYMVLGGVQGSGFGFNVFTRCKHHPISKPHDFVALNWVSPRPLIIANFWTWLSRLNLAVS